MRVMLESLGQSLISRNLGSDIREQILGEVGADATIELDFAGVVHASYSFIDELVGKLATLHQRGMSNASVLVANASDVVRSHVDRCFAVRGITHAACVA